VINDLGVLFDNRMTLVNHIESIVSKSAEMFGFIKRISREFSALYTYKTHSTQLYKICITRSGLDCSASASL
jgi:hypothetical protein